MVAWGPPWLRLCFHAAHSERSSRDLYIMNFARVEIRRGDVALPRVTAHHQFEADDENRHHAEQHDNQCVQPMPPIAQTSKASA